MRYQRRKLKRVDSKLYALQGIWKKYLNLLERYNGTPALINKMGHLVHRKGKYLEMDINIHAFGYVARAGLRIYST